MKPDNLVVYFKDKPALRLNARLITQKGLTEQEVQEIKRLHEIRLSIEECMRNTDSLDELQGLGKYWKQSEFALQEAWRFPKNSLWHRFWTVPKCTCPKLDNQDAYPYRQYFSDTCPVHTEEYINEGESLEEGEEK